MIKSQVETIERDLNTLLLALQKLESEVSTPDQHIFVIRAILEARSMVEWLKAIRRRL